MTIEMKYFYPLHYFPAMKYLLLALFGVCWASSIKDKDVFKPFSDDLIEYINKYSGAKWKVSNISMILIFPGVSRDFDCLINYLLRV